MSDQQPKTVWEEAALTRWGAYTTEIEKEALLKGHHLAGAATNALEVGCEGGRWSRLLSDLGWGMTCTDVDQKALAACQERSPTAKCILVHPEDTVLPCTTGALGLIACIEVPQVIQSDWFLPEAYRTLGKGGLIVGMFFNKYSGRGLFAHLAYRAARRRYRYDYYRLPYVAWRRKLRGAGFTLRYERGFCWFPFSRWSNSALVPFCTSFERSLGLQRLPSLSPWVAFVLEKVEETKT